VHDAIIAFFYGIGRTNLSTSGFVAMPANIRCRRNAFSAFDEVEVNHRFSAMRFAFLASL
jgi:hypothetical protein